MKKNHTEGNEVRTTLRLPAKLHEAISAAAETNERSFNNQIVFTLKQAFLPTDARHESLPNLNDK